MMTLTAGSPSRGFGRILFATLVKLALRRQLELDKAWKHRILSDVDGGSHTLIERRRNTRRVPGSLLANLV